MTVHWIANLPHRQPKETIHLHFEVWELLVFTFLVINSWRHIWLYGFSVLTFKRNARLNNFNSPSDFRWPTSLFQNQTFFSKKQWPSTRLWWWGTGKANGTKRICFADGLMLHWVLKVVTFESTRASQLGIQNNPKFADIICLVNLI